MHFPKPNLALLALLGWALLHQVIAVPVSRSPSPGHTSSSSSSSSEEDFPILPYNHGDVVGVRPSEYEKNPPKKISIHPGVVVDGPNHKGQYSVAMISKKLPHNPPQEDIKHFHPQSQVYGNVALSPPKVVRPKGMKPWKSDENGETAVPMNGHNLRKLKMAMQPHGNWRAPTPPPQMESSRSRGSKSGKGRRSNTGNKSSNPGPRDPRSHGVPMQYHPHDMQVAGPSHHPNFPSNLLHHTGPPSSRYSSGGRHLPNLPPVPNPHSGPYKSSGSSSHRPSNPHSISMDHNRHAPTAYDASLHMSAPGGHGSQNPLVAQHFSQSHYLPQHPPPHMPPYPHPPPQQHAPVYAHPGPGPSGGPMYHPGPMVHQTHPLSGPRSPYHAPSANSAYPHPPGPYHNPSAHSNPSAPTGPYHHPSDANPSSRGHSSRPPPLWRTEDHGRRPSKRMRR